MILISIYQLWKLEQPRVGPVGDGTISKNIYISIYSGIVSTVLGILTGILNIVNRKKWSKYKDEHLTKQQLNAKYIPLMSITGSLWIFVMIFIVSTDIGQNQSGLSGPFIGLFGFGAVFLVVTGRYLYFAKKKTK